MAGELPRAVAQPSRRTAHRDRSGKEGVNEHHRRRCGHSTRPVEPCASRTSTTPASTTSGRRARRRSGSRDGWPRSPGISGWAESVQVVFTSTGPARTDRGLRAPHHLLLTCFGSEEESELEAWLTEEGRGPASSWRSAVCRSTRCTSTAPVGRPISRTSDGRWPRARRSTRRVVLVQAVATVGAALGRADPGLSRHVAQRGVSGMRNPHAYPELILDSAQDEIRELTRKQARDAARRAAKTARRRSRGGLSAWWPRRGRAGRRSG